MADYIPANRPIELNVLTPLTLTALQTFTGGFIKFVDLPSGDILVINESSSDFAPINNTASSIAGRSIFGDVVRCVSSEIA